MSFNGDRLRVLRRFHNLTQRQLGELTGSPASAITAYERGSKEPKGLALDALCATLKVDKAFLFQAKHDDEFKEYETSFRSLTSTPDRLRKKILAHATLFGVLVQYIGRVIKLPQAKIPSLPISTLSDIEQAAERCRVEWGVGVDAPIKNVTRMVELAGVFVTVLDEAVSRQVDAFSRYGPTNLIVLNPSKGSATRTRFDIAHEAGHGALHRGAIATDPAKREDEADYFASCLLLPRKTFAREFWALGPVRTWEHFLELKQRWGVSLPALVIRAYHLGLMDAAEYRRRYKYMAKEGWLRGGEPGEPAMETPELFPLALGRFQAETNKSVTEIASDMKWTPELFQAVCGVLVEPTQDSTIHSIEEARRRKTAAG